MGTYRDRLDNGLRRRALLSKERCRLITELNKVDDQVKYWDDEISNLQVICTPTETCPRYNGSSKKTKSPLTELVTELKTLDKDKLAAIMAILQD